MNLTSVNNEKVKNWLKLKQKKYRDIEKLFLVEDEHLINEALQKKVVKEIITITDNSYDVPVYYVTKFIINKISDQVTGAKTIAVCYFIKEEEIKGNILVLDDIQDPGNLGTIIRSAVAFNFNTIVVSPNTVSKYNSKVLRASEGMFFHINIVERNLEEFLGFIKDKYTLITTDVKNGIDIRNIKSVNIALVIGNEGSGVKKELVSMCNYKVNIKMNNICESLNAATCASILMYEVYHG